MKQWLRILPLPILLFSVLTFLDYSANPQDIHWLLNLAQSLGLTAIGCVGQYLIHKNIMQDDDEDSSDGCINCSKP